MNGTLHGLPEKDPKPQPFRPYPEYNSAAWKNKWQGEYVSCKGPWDIEIDSTKEPLTTAYEGVPDGFPMPDIGSWEALGMDRPVCFDRNSRLGPFGVNLGEQESLDLGRTQWGKLQNECLERNANRFEDATVPALQAGKEVIPPRTGEKGRKRTSPKPRSAVLIRTWDTYEYQENDIMAIRSLVTELSLQSGGEYHVFLLVNIKDTNVQIFSDASVYAEYLEKCVPAELRDIAVLWTEAVCQEWYPKIGEWSVYWQQFMPIQWFSQTHPEFEYIWNWEMDARLIGQHYHFFEKMGNFAKQQPRKYLWERNARYYIPAKHGSWAQYFQDSNEMIEAAKVNMNTVWGPQPWSPEQATTGPKPPRKEKNDNFQWGVDEDADLITLLPMWDPRETWWSYRDRVFNFPGSESSNEERPFPDIPRRVFINTLVRFSATLLSAMHYENEAGLSMASEMWPASVALQHGLKAVYAPHPIWQSHVWDAEYMDMIFNADGWGAGSMPGHNIDDGRGVAYDRELEIQGKTQAGTGPNGEGKLARWGQERDAPYNPDREHNFAGWSWYFWSDFPRIIYWRWLGWKAGFSIVTIGGTTVTDELGLAGGPDVRNSPSCFATGSLEWHANATDAVGEEAWPYVFAAYVAASREERETAGIGLNEHD